MRSGSSELKIGSEALYKVCIQTGCDWFQLKSVWFK